MFSDYFMKVIATSGSGGGGNGELSDLDLLLSNQLISLESSAEVVEKKALVGNTGLEVVRLPQATTIKQSAFEGCSSIREVYIPKVTTIERSAFNNCEKITTFYAPELTTTTGSGVFVGLDSLEHLSLPKLQSVNDSQTFAYCGFITVDLPEVTFLHAQAFLGCTKLTTVNAPKFTAGNMSTFQNCSSLITVNVPSLTYIENGAYQGCSSLPMFDFKKPKSDAKIYSNAFYNCSSLKSLIIRGETVVKLDNINALTNTPIASGTGYIYVSSALVDTYKAATNWSTYAAQFRALEDYTVDGTITGDLDPTKTEVAA